MLTNSKRISIFAAIALLLSGCLTNEAGNINKTNVGTLGGAVAGAWIGSNIGKGKGNVVAIAAGTLLGAMAGRTIGASLDKADIAHHNQTQMNALEYNKTGSASAWKNPDTGASGTVTPTKTYVANSGEYCREYTQNSTSWWQRRAGLWQSLQKTRWKLGNSKIGKNL